MASPSDASSLTWKEVSSGRWERSADGLEGYFAVMANVSGNASEGYETFTIFSSIKIDHQLEDIETALRQAWTQLRYDQPHIAVTLEQLTKVYQVPDQKALEEWLTKTLIISQAANSTELHREMKPIKQATMYYLPKSSELVFRGNHYIVDGIGTLMVWDVFLSALTTPRPDVQFGEEHARLPPAMADVLGFEREPSEQMSKTAGEMFMDWAGSIPGIGPVSKLGLGPPGRSQINELVFSPEATSALVKACKNRNISVTAAVHAAYIEAVKKHADAAGKQDSYVTANQLDLRRYLPEPYNSSQFAASVSYTPMPYKMGLPADFASTTASLNEYYKNTFKNPMEVIELKGHFTNMLCSAAQTPAFLAQAAPRDALISSLGIAEKYLKHDYGGQVQVRDFMEGIEVTLGMSMLHFYTFDGKLKLAYSFNEAHEAVADIEKYMEEMRSVLANELDLPVDAS